MFDLDRDGKFSRSVAEGIRFDLDGDGRAGVAGWVGENDGLLARDVDQDGRITSGRELFGDATRLPDGRRATNGFEALAALDQNRDGVVDALDPAFAELKVWRDRNGDGVSLPDELQTLSEAGITAVPVRARAVASLDNGNLVGLVADAPRDSGHDLQLADVWLLSPDESSDMHVNAMLTELDRYADSIGGAWSEHDAQRDDSSSDGQTIVTQAWSHDRSNDVVVGAMVSALVTAAPMVASDSLSPQGLVRANLTGRDVDLDPVPTRVLGPG
jgi:hypothetical protein